MKIKSISDVITNSSNETYIIKNDGLLLSWDKLLSEWFFEPFDKDELVIFIEYILGKTLIDNPAMLNLLMMYILKNEAGVEHIIKVLGH